MNNELIYKSVKEIFCNLIQLKDRGNTVEIIVPVTTVSDKFVSLFITQRGDDFIISDGNWIEQGMYGNLFSNKEERDLSYKVIGQFAEAYNVKSTLHGVRGKYYYKKATAASLGADSFDMAHFIFSVTNTGLIRLSNEKDERERQLFRTKADTFMTSAFRRNFVPKYKFPDTSLKFHGAVLNDVGSKLYLVNYITGTTKSTLENDVRKSFTMYYALKKKTLLDQQVSGKFAIINNEAPALQENSVQDLLSLLNENLTEKAIMWLDRDRIKRLIVV